MKDFTGRTAFVTGGANGVGIGLVKSVIHASDDIRPDALKGAMKPVDQATVERLQGVHENGMEPDVIGARRKSLAAQQGAGIARKCRPGAGLRQAARSVQPWESAGRPYSGYTRTSGCGGL